MKRAVLALPGNAAFAELLAEHLEAAVIPTEFRAFPDQETYVRVDADCTDRVVFLVATLDRPDPKVLPIVFAAAAARSRGARAVVLVAPYLAYMRQDIAFLPGEAITAQVFPQIIGSAVDGLVTMDPHLHRIATLEDVYPVPAVNTHAAPAIAAWVHERVNDPVFVGPDVESTQWVSAVAREIAAPYMALEKVRRGDRDVEVSIPDLAAHRDRTPVIVDDIISTAHTMVHTVRHLRTLGTPAPVCVGVHGVFADDAERALRQAGAAQIVTTNTIAHPTNAIDVSAILAAGCDEVLERVACCTPDRAAT